MMNEKTKGIVAYFDFDGTITHRDTLIPFLHYVVGTRKFIVNLLPLLYVLLLYVLRIIDNEKAKELTLTRLIKGCSTEDLEEKACEFARFKLDRYLKPDIYYKLEYHLEHGHDVILVSANLAIYLRYWARNHNLKDVIATEVENKDGYATGRLATRNCYALEKVSRINQYLIECPQLTYIYSYGYGNSRGDYQMLDFVDEAYWVSGEEITPWIKRHERS